MTPGGKTWLFLRELLRGEGRRCLVVIGVQYQGGCVGLLSTTPMGEQLWLPDNSFAFSFMVDIKMPRKTHTDTQTQTHLQSHAHTHAQTLKHTKHTHTHTHRQSPAHCILASHSTCFPENPVEHYTFTQTCLH